MSAFVSLSTEILHQVLHYVDPTDLARLSQCSKTMHAFINSDELLWKVQYLNHFDDPLKLQPDASLWKGELQRFMRLRSLLEAEHTHDKENNLDEIAKTVEDLITRSRPTGPSRNVDFLASYFAQPKNTGELLHRSSLFRHGGLSSESPATTPEGQRLSAKLWVYYGISNDGADQRSEQDSGKPLHPFARSVVYDLRRYNEENEWGPFTEYGDSDPDWEKLQAIMIVLGYNHRAYCQRDGRGTPPFLGPAFTGLAANSYVSRPLPTGPDMVRSGPGELDPQDPFGVTGTWTRIVCFQDYVQLYSFNFENDDIAADQERPPLLTDDAIRLIQLRMRVTKIEPPTADEDPSTPIVHFAGTSRSVHMSWDPNANSTIKGFVRKTRSGVIRWTSFSIYHGEERWRSESIQIGGIRSARGCMGTWFDKDYDAHGPAGPTAFWKISDDIVEDKQAHQFPDFS